MNERGLAYNILAKWEETGFFHKVAGEGRLTPFSYRISKGVVENLILLDHLIGGYVKRSPGKAAMRILRMAFYELLFNDSSKDYAVTDEANKLASYRDSSKKGLINAVIRNFIRSGKKIRLPDIPVKRLSVQYSMPEWIVNLFLGQYGPDKTEKLLEFFLTQQDLDLRVSAPGITTDTLAANINEEGFEASVSEKYPLNVRVSGFPAIEKLPGYESGDFYVQDAAAQCLSMLLGPVKGPILDVGSAPGGKVTYFASVADGNSVTALDISSSRMKTLQQNLDRMRIKNVDLVVADFLRFRPDMKYSHIFIDAPCSGLGALRRKPDIKYRIKREDILSLKKLQKKMLEKSLELLDGQGEIIYATCTLNREENEDIVESFLARHADMELVHVEDRKHLKNTIVHDILTVRKTFLTFPPETNTDGMFGAVIRRRV